MENNNNIRFVIQTKETNLFCNIGFNYENNTEDEIKIKSVTSGYSYPSHFSVTDFLVKEQAENVLDKIKEKFGDYYYISKYDIKSEKVINTKPKGWKNWCKLFFKITEKSEIKVENNKRKLISKL